jgi:DNA-binding transcriptional MerR regulator
MAWSTRQLGDLAVTTVKAIRHYHEVGLLEVPERTANGYKQYQVAHLIRLLQIKRLRDLGVPLSQIAALAVILRHRAPMHVPPAFASVSQDLSDTNQSLLMIYSTVFSEEGMEDFRRVVAERGETDDEFDALPPDADDAAIERMAERMAPVVRRARAEHPWWNDPVSGRRRSGRTMKRPDRRSPTRPASMLYIVTMVTVERTQTGLRLEKNVLKVLKGLAEYLDISLGDLVEGIALHSFDGKVPFTPETLAKIEQLKAVYGLTLTSADAHRLTER